MCCHLHLFTPPRAAASASPKSKELELPLRPHTTGGQLEGNEQGARKPADAKQPTLEDLGRMLRERNQVHAWIDMEMQDDTLDGLPAAFENLKERISTWEAIRTLTDFKLNHEYEVPQVDIRREIMRRVKPVAAMGSPLSSNRPPTAAPQTGTEPRLLGGVVDVSFSDFPPVGRRGAISAEKAGVAASCPFRLCGDQWSIDLSCNKHWIKIHLCYKGCKPSVDRVCAVWFRREEPGGRERQQTAAPKQPLAFIAEGL
eukprot:Tamp_10365.p2 GENE.Tamp_10365~~Tamp_10365.p2  ORF type:complete len:257 (+),score=34.04 Tamp_10365:382-1152(+)